MDYTVSGLIAQVRRLASIPDIATTGNANSDILKHLNEALNLSIPAKVIACREGFYRKVLDVPLTSFTTDRRYRMPYRALGGRVAAILLIDSNGLVLRKLDELPYARLREFYSLNDTAGYIMEAGDIVLVPAMPSSTAVSVRFIVYMRPNELGDSAYLDVAGSTGLYYTVTAVNTSTGVITLMASHGLTTSDRLDIIKGTAPFEHVSYDIYASATASTTITVADASCVTVGDVVCKAEKAPFAQVPDPFYPILAQMGAANYLKALGDHAGYKRLMDELPKMEAEAIALISPRNEEGAKKIVGNFGSLGMVGGQYNRRYWGF